MPKQSKWFVVATEGATTDGRKISREWLTQIEKNYDPKKYGARINLEHFRWRYFDPNDAHSFSYGDVIAVKTEQNEEGKLQLFAQIEPTPQLVELVKNKQKVYTSIEIDPNFADSGEAYLVGLAVTDTPASLGTEYLIFCANAQTNPLNHRKQRPENFISEAVAVELEFWALKESLMQRIKQLFGKQNEESGQRFAEQEQAILTMAQETAELQHQVEQLTNANQQLQQQLTALSAQAVNFAEKFAQLEQEESKHYTPRPVATGANMREQQADF